MPPSKTSKGSKHSAKMHSPKKTAKKVMVFGTFDLVHEGHKFLFKEAKKYGDVLIAVIARDVTVKRMKHHAPLHSEQERRVHVLETGLVDEAILGGIDDYFAVLDSYKPDVICLGYDQHSSISEKLQDELLVRGLHTIIVHIAPFQPHIYKSSKLKAQMNHKKTTKTSSHS